MKVATVPCQGPNGEVRGFQMTDVLSQRLLQNETDNKRSFHTRIIHKPLKTISKDNDYGVSMINREGFAMIQLD